MLSTGSSDYALRLVLLHSSSSLECPAGGGNPPPMDDGAGGPMHQCSSCGRSFNDTAFPKHVKVGQRKGMLVV